MCCWPVFAVAAVPYGKQDIPEGRQGGLRHGEREHPPALQLSTPLSMHCADYRLARMGSENSVRH